MVEDAKYEAANQSVNAALDLSHIVRRDRGGLDPLGDSPIDVWNDADSVATDLSGVYDNLYGPRTPPSILRPRKLFSSGELTQRRAPSPMDTSSPYDYREYRKPRGRKPYRSYGYRTKRTYKRSRSRDY